MISSVFLLTPVSVSHYNFGRIMICLCAGNSNNKAIIAAKVWVFALPHRDEFTFATSLFMSSNKTFITIMMMMFCDKLLDYCA